ncbi:MAG: DUF2059 domain-containing protein [Sulfurovaceae bacterium]|jgi:hypothetical protein
MKKLIFILLVLLHSVFANADDIAKRESVEKLLKVMNVDSMVEVMYSETEQMYPKIAKDLKLTKSEQHIFNKFILNVTKVMKEEITWEKLKEPIIGIYMKHYSEKEINDLLAFYDTETGQSIIKKMPIVMKDSMMVSRTMLIELAPKFNKFSEDMLKELKQVRSKK